MFVQVSWLRYKCWIIIELMSQKTQILMSHVSVVVSVICHYWYFLSINFRFQTKACDGFAMYQERNKGKCVEKSRQY